MRSKNKNISIDIAKKDIIQLYSENMTFTIGSMVVLSYKNIFKGQKVEFFVYISFLSSILTSAYVIYSNIYIYKYILMFLLLLKII